ncbi:MAG: hypothetical protein AB7U29_19420 [Desulfobulbus sp.]
MVSEGFPAVDFIDGRATIGQGVKETGGEGKEARGLDVVQEAGEPGRDVKGAGIIRRIKCRDGNIVKRFFFGSIFFFLSIILSFFQSDLSVNIVWILIDNFLKFIDKIVI